MMLSYLASRQLLLLFFQGPYKSLKLPAIQLLLLLFEGPGSKQPYKAGPKFEIEHVANQIQWDISEIHLMIFRKSLERSKQTHMFWQYEKSQI